jgi:hypothetical protein
MMESATVQEISADDIATEILANDAGHDGAAKFEGWVAGPSGDDPVTFRVYTQPTFLEWVEIAADDILGQVKVTTGRPVGGSTVWVRRGASITRSQVGSAQYFEDLARGASCDDPAATRYPPHG